MMALIAFLCLVQVAHAVQYSARLSLAEEQEHGSFLAPRVDSSDCDGTVAYVFLVRDSIPLWPVWNKYFSSCPAGSYTVLVHSQNQSVALSHAISTLGAKKLDPGHTLTGDLRFSFGMVEAMLNLYSGVKGAGTAPNGCKPRWIHMSSDSCAPVAPCAQVHDHVKQHPYGSFVAQGPPVDYTKGVLKNTNVKKSPQWTTLWADHAYALASDKEAIRKTWEHRQHTSGGGGLVWFGGGKFLGALDEYVIANEIRSRKFPGQEFLGTLTGSVWMVPKPGEKVTSSPDRIATVQGAQKLIDAQKDHGKLFMRKFEAEPSIMHLLMSYVEKSQYSTAWLDEFANRTAR